MPAVVVTSDLVQLAPLDVVNDAAFALEWPHPNRGPNLTIRTAIKVSGDSVTAIVDRGSDPTGTAWVMIDTNGSLNVSATGAGGRAQAFSGTSWSPNFVNYGQVAVTGQASAAGLVAELTNTFVNRGTFLVTSAAGPALGFSTSDGYIENSGLLEVRGHTSALGVSSDGYVTNSGTLRVVDDNPSLSSVAIELTDYPVVVNSGVIEADYAIRYHPRWPNDIVGAITNTGTMIGRVELSETGYLTGAVRFVNSGTVRGDIAFGARADRYDGRLGLVVGIVSGGAGDDSLVGGVHADWLRGDLGADTLDGGAGDDVLAGGRDGDLIQGGDGFDTADYSDATMSVALDLSAGRAFSSGEDTLSGIERVVGGAFGDTLAGAAGDETLSGGGGADSIFGREGADSLVGGAGANFLRGEEGDDWIVGGDDFDDAHGNMGNDTVAGGAGDDWVVGGKDNDLLYGDAGSDIVWGNLGNDTCDGGDGDDQVRGGQGDDIVRGGAGNDWLSGDRGDDILSGGTGADIFHIFAEAGLDRVTDFNAAEGDRVFLLAGSQYVTYQFGADTIVDVTAVDGAVGRLILIGVELSGLPAGWIFGA